MNLSRQIDGQQVTISVADHHGPLGEDVLETLQKLDAKGPPLRDGMHVAFGWTVLTLTRVGEELRVYEPDFRSDPLQFTSPMVYDTLWVLAAQISLCKKVRVEPQVAWYTHQVLVRRGVLDERRVYLERRAPSTADDSGWFIGSVEKHDQPPLSDLDAMPVLEVYRRRRTLLEAMALPTGYLAVYDGDVLEAVLDSGNHNLLAGTTP